MTLPRVTRYSFSRKAATFFIVSVICLFVLPASALDPDKRFTQYTVKTWGRTVKTWGRTEGIPNETVVDILQASDGYLWLATFNGLVRFDGIQFQTYSKSTSDQFPTRTVWKVKEDTSGNLWIGTDDGLFRMRDGKFERFTTENNLLSNAVRALAVDSKGNVWVGTVKGVSVLRAGAKDLEDAHAGLNNMEILSLYLDGEENLWVGTVRDGHMRLRADELTRFESPEGEPFKQVYSFSEDGDGAIWLSSYGVGLFKLVDDVFEPWLKEHSDKLLLTKSLVRDAAGNLWIGTDNGIFRWNNNSLSGHSEDRSSVNVWSFYEDSDANLWVGTYYNGLMRFQDGVFTTFSMAEGLSDNLVTSVAENEDGAILIGTMERTRASTG